MVEKYAFFHRDAIEDYRCVDSLSRVDVLDFAANVYCIGVAFFVFSVLKEILMDQDQVRKAFTEDTKLEYLFDDNQWVPATISHYQDGSSHSLNVTIRLLRYPREHPGIIHLSADDIQNRLRLKGSN